MTQHIQGTGTGEHSKSTNKSAQSLKGYVLAIAAACGWSTGGLISNLLMTKPSAATSDWLIKPFGAVINPTVLSGARAFIATIILGIFLAFFKRKSFKLKNPASDLLFLVPFGALALAGMHFSYFKAISTSNVTTAILLEYLAPVLTLFYGVFVLKHKVSWRMPLGVALSILGCAVVVGAFSPGGLLISHAGLIWGLIAAFFFALYSTMGGRGGIRFSPFTLLFYGLLFAAVMWLIVLGPHTVISAFSQPKVGLAIVVIACISTIIPFAAYLHALKYISPTHATIAAMVEPVVAALCSWVLFKDPITWSLALGGLIIVGAIVLIQFSELKDVDE